MNRIPRKSPRHIEPTTVARAAAVTLLAAALVGVPVSAQARPTVDGPRVLGYGSGA